MRVAQAMHAHCSLLSLFPSSPSFSLGLDNASWSSSFRGWSSFLSALFSTRVTVWSRPVRDLFFFCLNLVAIRRGGHTPCENRAYARAYVRARSSVRARARAYLMIFGFLPRRRRRRSDRRCTTIQRVGLAGWITGAVTNHKNCAFFFPTIIIIATSKNGSLKRDEEKTRDRKRATRRGKELGCEINKSCED